MEETLCVAAGAIAGALLRWKATTLGNKFGVVPWSTVGINMIGSFALGIIAAKSKNQRTTLLLGTGFCGSLTTFSTFSVDVVNFVERNQYGKAAAYVASSNILGIGAAAVGYRMFRVR